jgi:hypothetical protein
LSAEHYERAKAGTVRNRVQRSGIRVRARIQEQSKVIVTTLKRGAVYSPVVDLARKIGRKAAAVVSEDTSKGTANSLDESTAASRGFLPAAI